MQFKVAAVLAALVLAGAGCTDEGAVADTAPSTRVIPTPTGPTTYLLLTIVAETSAAVIYADGEGVHKEKTNAEGAWHHRIDVKPGDKTLRWVGLSAVNTGNYSKDRVACRVTRYQLGLEGQPPKSKDMQVLARATNTERVDCNVDNPLTAPVVQA